MYIKAKLVFASLMLVVVIGAGVVALIPIKANAGSHAGFDCIVIPQRICNEILGDPVSSTYDPASTAQPLVNFVVAILTSIFGAVLVLIVIVSAVQITMSGGKEEQVKKGKENIFKAVTGLVLLISFRAIMLLVNLAFEDVNTKQLFTRNVSVNEASFGIAGIPTLINNVIGIALFLGGALAVIFVIVGGIQYITSGGGEGIKKAKKTIIYALAGLVISISAYGILFFIQTQLQK